MDIYNYNISSYNVDQIINDVYLQMNKKLVATYEGEFIDGYFTGYDTSVEFGFYINLTTQEQEILTNLISNYVYDQDYHEKKKFKLNNSHNDPSQIDYDILGFHKRTTMVTGELRSAEYYKNYVASSDTYSDLVISEFREYIRNSLGLLLCRHQTSNWICNDNSTGLTLTFEKYYSPEKAINEGIDRRNNMLSSAKIIFLDDLKAIYGEPTNQTYAFSLLMSVKTQMDYFIQGYTQPLRDVISASTRTFMGICQQDRATASVVDGGVFQVDSIIINNVSFEYTSSDMPTKSEIANGLINLITGTTDASVSTYVSVIRTDIDNGIFDLKAKIPGWPFTLIESTNISLSSITANNNTIKTNIIEQLAF